MAALNVSTTRADVDAGVSEKDKVYHPPSPSEVEAFTKMYQSADIDKEFEPPEPLTSPYPQSNSSGILWWQAALNSLSVLCFLAGPEGVVLSTMLVFASSALSAVPASNKGAPDSLKLIRDLIGRGLKDHELGKRVGHVASYGKFIDQHRGLFNSLEFDTTGDRPVYSRHSTFKGNLEVLKESVLPTLLEFARPGPTGLYDRLADLGEDGVHPAWNRSDIRAFGIAIDTLLFITMKYIALFYARHAAHALREGDEKGAAVHITSYYNQMDTMQKTIDDRLKLVEENMTRLRDWRLARVSGVKKKDDSRDIVFSMFVDVPDPQPFAVSYWVDDYTKKEGPCYNASIKSTYSRDWDHTKSDVKATADRDAYVTRLKAHIARVLRPDEMVRQAWTATMKAASKFLCPPDPIMTTLKHELKHVESPSTWLHDATFVQYAYQVENEHGTSERGPWSEEKAYDGHNLPVVELKSSYTGEVTWVVWHKKKLASGQAEEAIAAKIDGSRSLEWVDEHHGNPGGR